MLYINKGCCLLCIAYKVYVAKGMRMKAVTEKVPKPLAKVNNKPILWYIMKQYHKFGHNQFILPLGYKGEEIKDYFDHYRRNTYNYTLDLSSHNKTYYEDVEEDWKISFIDTGIQSLTGKRLRLIEDYITDDTFMLTYGDGLADVDIDALLEQHKKMNKIVTVTTIHPRSPYGIITEKKGQATGFIEKPMQEHLVNGGFFVCNKEIFKYLDDGMLEDTILEKLTKRGELAVYFHDGFWIGIDTCKDIETASDWLKGSNYYA